MIKTFDYTLKKLISEKDYLFQVPNYQRNYVWTEKEVLRFVRDGYFCMQKFKDANNKFEHYAGQMIFRSLEKKRDGKERMEIIDGQQRLTTFEILVVAVIDILNMCEENANAVDKLKSRYLLAKSISSKEENDMVLCLAKKEQNFWHNFVEGVFSKEKKKELKLESQKRIWNAHEVIKKYFVTLTDDLSMDDQQKLLLFYIEALAESFRVVVLITEDIGHEFSLFQIVNDRGIPLTPGELLKARTIELLTSHERGLKRIRLVQNAEELWEDILSDSGDTTESYLVWNYMAIIGKQLKSISEIPVNEQYEQDIFQCLDKREISMDMQDQMLEQLKLLQENINICRDLEAGKFPIKGANSYLNLLLGILIRNMKNKMCIPLYLRIIAVNREKDALVIAEALTEMLVKCYPAF